MADGPDGRGGPHFFVEDLDRPALSEDDRRHGERSLRLRTGESITISDGAGRWREGRWGDDLEPDGAIVEVPPPSTTLTVGFALVKGSKPEFAVQKLTELGIDRVVPFVAERSVVRWDADKAAKAATRWATVARAAAMQSRRVRIPEILPLSDFHSAAAEHGSAVRAHLGGRAPTLDDHTVLVGPEGGWSDAERGTNCEEVSFGPHVLRAETAVVTVAAVLVTLRGGLVRPSDDRE